MDWLLFAFIGAFAAAATAVLSKAGVRGVSSNVATAIRTTVVFVCAWLMVLVRGEHHDIAALTPRSLVFLAVSGITTGVSWLAYFRALTLAPASRVAPIDKASLALTVVLSAIFLGEEIRLPVGIGTMLVVAGTLLTIMPTAAWTEAGATGWWQYALVSAVAAAATGVLARAGIEGVSSDLATALRCIVVLAFAWGIVLARGQWAEVGAVPRRSLWALVTSGVAAAVSWLAYYHALSLAPVSRVAPVDKTSLAFTVLFAAIFLREPMSKRLVSAVVLIVGGALLTLVAS